jgi:CRP/FNR family cyclic AMP-dependent transcriptional regulator
VSDQNQTLFERFGKGFPPGTVLFREGDSGKEMYVVQAGKVRISKTVRGVEKSLVDLGAGEFFGEMAVLNDKPRTANATVVDEAKLLVIDPKTFEAMVRGNAEIAIRIIKMLAKRLEETDKQIENLLLKDHNSRVVHMLAYVAKSGKPVAGGVLVPMGVADIAAKAGLELDKVDEVIQKLIRAKLITQQDDGMVVGDVNKLREFLEFLEMKEKFGNI